MALFLPSLAFVLIIVGTGFFLLNNWSRVKEAGFGGKAIVLPLSIIILAMALSGINAQGVESKIAPLFMGISLGGLYLVARVLGKNIFIPLAIGVAIASLGVIAYRFTEMRGQTGGYIFEHNFDILTGYLILGVALFIHRWRWLLCGVALIALILSGSPEAVFAVGVILIAVLVRRDWSRKLLYIAAPALMVVIIIFFLGPSIYNYIWHTIRGEETVNTELPSGERVTGSPITWRWDTFSRAFSNIKLLGEGYGATNFTVDTVHNVPLILVQQMGYPGMVAALAWLWLTFYCLVKTKWKYVWIAIIALAIFDHYLWTQLGPWFFAIVGVSTTLDAQKPDYLFRSVL